MNAPNGFTLVEVTVVILIISALGAIAVPNIATWTQSHHLRGAASALYSDMTTARIRTIKDKVRHSLRVDGAGGQWILYHVGANGLNENGGGDDVILRTRRLSEFGESVVCGIGDASGGVTDGTLEAPDFTTFGANRVTFNAMGQCNAGFFYLANGQGGSVAVGTLSSGVVRVRQWKGDSTWE